MKDRLLPTILEAGRGIAGEGADFAVQKGVEGTTKLLLGSYGADDPEKSVSDFTLGKRVEESTVGKTLGKVKSVVRTAAAIGEGLILNSTQRFRG